jgi:hypothetical protein
MKAEKFTGSGVDQLEVVFMQLFQHQEHFMLFTLADLNTGSIRCSTCKIDVVVGSRELLELVWLEWSMIQTESDHSA